VIQLSKLSLKLRGLDRSKDRIEPVVRRNAVPEINDLAKPRAFRLRKLHDSHEVIRATDHGADRDHDEGHERIGDLSGSRIRQTCKMNLDTRLRNSHGQSSMTTTRWHAPRARIKAAFAQSCQMPQYRAIALPAHRVRWKRNATREVALQRSRNTTEFPAPLTVMDLTTLRMVCLTVVAAAEASKQLESLPEQERLLSVELSDLKI